MSSTPNKPPCKITDSKSLESVGSALGPIQTHTICTLDKDIILDRLRVEIIEKLHFTLGSPSTFKNMSASSVKPNNNGKRKKGDTRSDNSTSKRRQRCVVSKDNAEYTSPSTVMKVSNINSVPTATMIQEDMTFQAIRKRIIIGTNQCTRALESARIVMSRMGRVGGEDVGKKERGPLPSLVMLARDVRPPTILAHIPFLCRLLQIPLLLLPGKASSDMGRLFDIKTVSIVIFTEESTPHTNAHHQAGNQLDSYIKFAKTKVPKINSVSRHG